MLRRQFPFGSMFGRTILALGITVALGLAGCTGSDSRGDEPWSVDDEDTNSSTDTYTPPGDPSPDAGPPTPDPSPDQPDTETPPPPERPVTLRLNNASDSPVHVVPPGCRQHEADWRKLYADASFENDDGSDGGAGGNALRRVQFEYNGCQSCRCSQISGSTSCGVACFACGTGQLKTVRPGDAVEYRWNGTYFVSSSKNGTDCQRSIRPPAGRELDAELCWFGAQVDQENWMDRDPECIRKNLAVGETEVVEHVVDSNGSTGPHKTTFRLRNDTSEVVYTRRPAACTQTQTDWLKIAKLQPNDAVLRQKVDTDCTECICSDDGGAGCAVCRAACGENGLSPLKPGKTVEWTWEGYLYERAEDRQCYHRRVPSAGEQFQTAFCHVEAADDGSRPANPAQNMACGRRFIEYGDKSTITHRISQTP